MQLQKTGPAVSTDNLVKPLRKWSLLMGLALCLLIMQTNFAVLILSSSGLSKEHLQGSLARKFELRELPYELGCYRDKA
uniref:Uncharacterized protein n=1 Tax=Helianthus annuus TaxID=4232 RepID=A0A251TFM8_HELAN